MIIFVKRFYNIFDNSIILNKCNTNLIYFTYFNIKMVFNIIHKF